MKYIFPLAVVLIEALFFGLAIIEDKPVESLVVYGICLIGSIICLCSYLIIEEIKKCK